MADLAFIPYDPAVASGVDIALVGGVVFAPAAGSAAGGGQTLSFTVGGVSVTLPAGSAAGSGPALSFTVGPVSMALPAGSAAGSGVDLAFVKEGPSFAPAVGTASGSGAALSLAAGPASFTPGVGAAAGGGPALSFGVPPISFTPAVGSAAGSGVSLAFALGAAPLVPSAGSGAGGGVGLTLTAGAISVAFPAGSGAGAGVDLDLIGGAVLGFAVGSAVASGVDFSFIPGAMSFALGVGSAAGGGDWLSVTPGFLPEPEPPPAPVPPPGTVVVTSPCLHPCCLPDDCRCGSNYVLTCPLPDPPAVFGRAMPAVLYGQVTGFRTLRVLQRCFGAPPPLFQVGGCWEYLSQIVNWPFRRAGGGYASDYALFANTDPRLGPVDCTFLGFAPRAAVPVGVSFVSLDFGCSGEARCTFAGGASTVLPSCGEVGLSPPNCTSYSLFPAAPLANVVSTVSLDPRQHNWFRSGVVSCDPWWGRVEFFDALSGGYLPGGDPTCDQGGHPDPPCCPHPLTGLKGPCGLASVPPQVLAYREISPFGVPCNDEVDGPLNRALAALAVRLDLFETAV